MNAKKPLNFRFAVVYDTTRETHELSETTPTADLIFDEHINKIIAGALVMSCDTWWEAARDEATALSDHLDDRLANLDAFKTALALENLIENLGIVQYERPTNDRIIELEQNAKEMVRVEDDEINPFTLKWADDTPEGKHLAIYGESRPKFLEANANDHNRIKCDLCRWLAEHPA